LKFVHLGPHFFRSIPADKIIKDAIFESVQVKAKEYFKGSKINDREGEKIRIQWKLKDGEDDTVHFSKNDMKRMAAEIGDLVYISDVRKYFGGLKSVHSVYGEPHNEDGLVYIFKDHAAQGQFVEGRTLLAEKEM